MEQRSKEEVLKDAVGNLGYAALAFGVAIAVARHPIAKELAFARWATRAGAAFLLLYSPVFFCYYLLGMRRFWHLCKEEHEAAVRAAEADAEICHPEDQT